MEFATVEAPPLERKLVAILAADVAGYSRMMHQDEDATLATLTTHRTVIDDLIIAGRGEISGTAGDSVLAEFASVVDAVHCAVAIQQALHKCNANLTDERRMRLRIGINVGDVLVKDGTIFGDGVNVASRLEGLAEPGSVCITRCARPYPGPRRVRVRGSRRAQRQEHRPSGSGVPDHVRPKRHDRTPGSCWSARGAALERCRLGRLTGGD